MRVEHGHQHGHRLPEVQPGRGRRRRSACGLPGDGEAPGGDHRARRKRDEGVHLLHGQHGQQQGPGRRPERPQCHGEVGLRRAAGRRGPPVPVQGQSEPLLHRERYRPGDPEAQGLPHPGNLLLFLPRVAHQHRGSGVLHHGECHFFIIGDKVRQQRGSKKKKFSHDADDEEHHAGSCGAGYSSLFQTHC